MLAAYSAQWGEGTGGTPDFYAGYQRDRVAVRDGAVAPAGGEGGGLPHEELLMAYKLLDMAQARWRRLDGTHLLPLVRAGIVFVDGVQQEGAPPAAPRPAH
jgi:hypothetical protein